MSTAEMWANVFSLERSILKIRKKPNIHEVIPTKKKKNTVRIHWRLRVYVAAGVEIHVVGGGFSSLDNVV